jgi:hypothetical protein
MRPFQSLLAVVMVVGLDRAGPLSASDTPTKSPAPTAGSAIMPSVGCPSCGGVPVTAGHVCTKPGLAGRSLHPGKNEPYVVNLCPGACFGYFQTQWRRWDTVCPYPYLGTGVSDAPTPPVPKLKSPSDQLPGKGGTLPEPRPSEPKKVPPAASLPPIPIPPG